MDNIGKIRVRINDIKVMVCCWRDCTRMANMRTLPDGWRVIVMSRGLLLDTRNLMNADRDGALCPEHFDKLDALLKPIPRR